LQNALETEANNPVGKSIRVMDQENTLARPLVVSRRRSSAALLLICSDVLLALVIWQMASVLQIVFGQGQLSQIANISVVPNVVAWVGLRAVLGLYPGYGLDQVEELRRQTFALGASLAIITVFAFASQIGDSLSRLLLLTWALGLLLLAPLARNLVKTLARNNLWGKPIVILSAAGAGAKMANILQKEWQLGFKPVGIFGDTVPSDGALAATMLQDSLDDAAAAAREHGVDTVVVAMPQSLHKDLVKVVDWVNRSFKYVIVITDLGMITNSAVIARDFAGDFAVEIKQTLLFPWARRIKHAMDLFLTVVGGLLIAPLLIAITILVKLDSPGPVFYGHRRLGAGGEYFRCWKFRTMYTNAEQLLDEYLQGKPLLQAEWEETFKLRDDPRVTRVGKFLRKTSLDELPQLWNVLRGEMSLVGPRPIVDAEVTRYGAVYEMYQRIRPGISGFWQVSGRSDTSYGERVKLDAYYVRNWSVWLDAVILVRTVGSVIFRRGAY
jgi:Undecaprenyl-phosphate galactose phosphotransferase WbaP